MKKKAPVSANKLLRNRYIIIALLVLASFAIILAASLIIKLATPKNTEDEETTKPKPAETTDIISETDVVEGSDTAAINITTAPETTATPDVTTEAPPVVTEPVVTTDILDIEPIEPNAFDNTLFIGDSRTVGLRDYADLGNAVVFADHGINVFRVLKEPVDVGAMGKIKLEQLLSENSFNKIYIMLGLNEIGYEENAIIKKYADVLDFVKSLQPDANIYLMANLHITSDRSSRDPIYNNLRLNAINEQISFMADGDKVFYLDSNVIFDDDNGCLKVDYTVDDFHLKGKYYAAWAQWIAHNS